MDDLSIQQSNPWVDSGPSHLKDVLLLAERTGHLRKGNDDTRYDVGEERRERSPSLKLIQQLKHITALRKEINKVNLEIQLRLQDKETKDLTHHTVQEGRIKKINTLTSHLESVTNQKDLLLSRLQQPFVGEYLKVEAPYHKYACEIFPQVVALLAELSVHLDNINWAATANIKDKRLEDTLDSISGQLIRLQTHFQTNTQLRSMMEHVHHHQATPR